MIDRKRRAGEAAERMAMEAMVDSAESTSHLKGCDNFEYTLSHLRRSEMWRCAEKLT